MGLSISNKLINVAWQGSLPNLGRDEHNDDVSVPVSSPTVDRGPQPSLPHEERDILDRKKPATGHR